MFKQIPPQPTSEAIKIIAFSSGEGVNHARGADMRLLATAVIDG